MTDFKSIRDSVVEALDRREFESAVTAASTLVSAGQPWLVEGLMMRAVALEHWNEGPPDRLTAAARDWQRVIDIDPCSVSHRGLARVQLKLGDRECALRNLLEAQRRAKSPEVLLGFAQYHRTASPPDLEKAKSYYLRAALRGRTQGVRGFVEVAYDLGQPLLAATMVLAGLIATPLLALVLGERRHDGL